MERWAAFAPVVEADARVLILGSLPGALSLARGQYYAHPRNSFWPLLGAVTGTEIAALGYAERLAALRAARIGLWDVIATAARRGSLDGAIRDPAPADLAALLARLPAVRVVAFNGAKAAAIGRNGLSGRATPELIDLPSSSPAHAAMSFAEKRRRWSCLAGYLR